MEISNKTLAWLVVAAIVVSIFGTTLSVINMSSVNPTGYATTNDTGLAAVLVSTSVVLRFQQIPAYNSTDFGTGQINTSGGYASCNMAVNDTTGTGIKKTGGCIGFSTTATALVIENVGTSNLNVTLNFSANDTSFLLTKPGTGNASRWLKYTVYNTTANGGCINSAGISSWGVWTDVPAPNTTILACGNLTTQGTGNYRILIGLNVSINENITNTQKYLTIRAQGTDI